MRKQNIEPTSVRLTDLKQGEVLLVRYEVVTATNSEKRTACIQLLDDADAFCILSGGERHVRVEVVLGPVEWGDVVTLIIGASNARVPLAIKRWPGDDAVPVTPAGLASKRNIALAASR